MTISEALSFGRDFLSQHNIENSRLEAEILLDHVLKIGRPMLVSKADHLIGQTNFSSYQKLLARRSLHEPTAYITGYQPFLGMNIEVNLSVLIPRPETEILVEEAIKTPKDGMLAARHKDFSVADIGTGSGAIAVLIAKRCLNARVIGIDNSSKALETAKKNAETHKVSDRCRFVKGNLLEPLKEPVDIIIANPPYIPTSAIDALQPEVKDWEPKEALDGGKDGLDYIRKIIALAPKHLNPNGYLFFEFGFGQADLIREYAKDKFVKAKFKKDYAGIERIFIAEQN